jgi:hypothetical protein
MASGSLQREALALSEGVTLSLDEGAGLVFDSDGTIPLHIIRPGVGKGRGRHLYEASMLARDAKHFTGWRMYVDHQSPEARRAAGGLPRSVRDLGGRIVEAHWDPSVPPDPKRGFGQGAVVGRARPVRWLRELIEDDPELVEASISARATGVREVHHQGQRVWAVEGIEPRGSVDWVTEAGCGGRVAPLIESSYASEEAVELALLESMTDEELIEFLHEQRPGLVAEAKSDDKDDGGKDDDSESGIQAELDKPDEDEDAEADAKFEARVKKMMGKGMSRSSAEKFAKNIKEAQEDDMPITPEALQEALSSSPDLLAQALTDSEALQSLVEGRVRAALAEEKVLADAERDAVIDRQWELRDLRDRADRLIAESRLPDSWQDGLRKRFSLREDRSPTSDLDVVDDVDAEGNVVKTAAEKLTEAVSEAIKTERHRLAEVAPTRVRNQGPAELKEGEEGDVPPPADSGFHRSLLQEAGIDIDKAYAGI